MAGRFFINTLPDYAPGAHERLDPSALRSSLRSTLQYVLQSSENLEEPSVYTGGAGIAYMLWRLASMPGTEHAMPKGEAVEGALEYARHALQQQRVHGGGHRCSLLVGEAGACCVAALCTNTAASHEAHAGRMQRSSALRAESADCLQSFNALSQAAASSACEEDEVLFGKAGLLLGCLHLNRHLKASAVPADTLRCVAEAILRSGRHQAKAAHEHGSPLWFVWHGSPYLGAAHGMMGILHVLLLLPKTAVDSIPGAWDDIRGALRFVLSLECDEGGLPAPEGFWPAHMHPRHDREPLVHWCHGSAGAVFLLAQAHEVLGGEGKGLLKAALRCGEVVWQRGLLRKGPGMCHGISGNAYALLRLWRATGDDSWLHRAGQFAQFLSSEEFRRGARTPDRPASLFEGWAAAACLYADLVHPVDARFPLFEL